MESEQSISKQNQIQTRDFLTFTGNWFIDAGILGFVNLMEEVYGWEFENLQKMIIKEPEKVYYGYFPFAYLYKWLSDRNLEVNPKLIEKLEEIGGEYNLNIFKNG